MSSMTSALSLNSPIAEILPSKIPRSQFSTPFSVTIFPFLKIRSSFSICLSLAIKAHLLNYLLLYKVFEFLLFRDFQ